MKSKPAQKVLQCVVPRIIQPSSVDEAQLGLEVVDGPYKGVTFGFTKFEVREADGTEGFVPVKFETTVYSAPDGFQTDESFDMFTSEILLAWLEFIAGEAPKGN